MTKHKMPDESVPDLIRDTKFGGEEFLGQPRQI
jgi:hypothetical protein